MLEYDYDDSRLNGEVAELRKMTNLYLDHEITCGHDQDELSYAKELLAKHQEMMDFMEGWIDYLEGQVKDLEYELEVDEDYHII